MLVIDMFPRT